MSMFTIAAGTTSRPHSVPAGSIVKVSPAAGATANVEYTSASLVEVANGVAGWAPWSKGSVGVETSDVANNPFGVRVTAVGGDVVLNIEANPGAEKLRAFRPDWGGPGSAGNGAAKYFPSVSQYDRALIIPHIRQSIAIKSRSRNINAAQYCGAITDADVYDTEAGALSVGMLASKALAFYWSKMQWDLNNGESLLVQARVKSVGATSSSQILFGNQTSAISWEGWALAMYGPAHASSPGRLYFNYRGNGSAAQAVELNPVLVAPGSVSRILLATDTYYNITLHVDGATKRVDVWVNCQPGLNNTSNQTNAGTNNLLLSGSTIPAVKRNFGLGYGSSDDSFTASGAAPARFQAFRMAVLPAGLKFHSPADLDLEFNINPYRKFSDADYLGNV